MWTFFARPRFHILRHVAYFTCFLEFHTRKLSEFWKTSAISTIFIKTSWFFFCERSDKYSSFYAKVLLFRSPTIFEIPQPNWYSICSLKSNMQKHLWSNRTCMGQGVLWSFAMKSKKVTNLELPKVASNCKGTSQFTRSCNLENWKKLDFQCWSLNFQRVLGFCNSNYYDLSEPSRSCLLFHFFS